MIKNAYQLVLYFLFLSLGMFITADVSAQELYKLNRTEVHTIGAKASGRTYRVFVKLPYDYNRAASRTKKYPVIYTNDGPFPFKIAASVTHARVMDKAIVIGLSYAQGEKGMHSRVRDLTPIKNDQWVRFETGGADQFIEFMEKDLFPFVENKYRINKEERIYAGQSLGGLFGAYVLLKRPELFKGYILTSPSLWFFNKGIFDIEKDYANNHKDLKANLYLATGSFEAKKYGAEYDMADDMAAFALQLRSRNYPNLKVFDEVIQGTIHENTFPVGFSKGLYWHYSDQYKSMIK